MSSMCKRLHDLVFRLPEIVWPFDMDQLPKNGIYFFFEKGETWGHGGDHPRIVRVGTHREDNFRLRIEDHYVFKERRMDFDAGQVPPKDRSVFRKNIGLAILHRNSDPYEMIWKIDFTTRHSRETDGSRRNLQKEKQIELQVTRILREEFSFRWVELEGQDLRMGRRGLEAELIGTLARCGECCASANWLGRFSPKPKIAHSGLWLEQHLSAPELTEEKLEEIGDLFRKAT